MGLRRWLYPKDAMVRGVGMLVGGTAAAQLLTVLAAPLLTRLYSPEAFGALATFAAVLALCIAAAAARYEIAIPVPENDSDAANLTLLCLSIGVIFSTFLAIALFILREQISSALNTPELDLYIWLIPLATLAAITYEIFFYLSLRSYDYGLVAKTRATQALGTVSIQVLGSPFGVAALVGGQVIGQGMGSLRLIFANIKKYSWSECSFKGLKQQAYIHRQYPQYALWSALLNTVSLQAAPLIFITTYGAVVAGLYALTLRVLTLPGNLVGGAIGSVFLAEAPDALRRDALKPLLLKLHTSLSSLGALPLVTLLFFGEDLFRFVFGDLWGRAGSYAQMMAPWIYLQFKWAPLSTVGNLLGLQKQILLTHVFNFLLRFSVLVSCGLFSVPADQGVLAFATISAVIYFVITIWFFRKAGLSIKTIVFTDIKYISIATLICIPPRIMLDNLNL